MGNYHLYELSKSAHAIREPLLRELIKTLRLPVASHGLDAGCGSGHPALLLAAAVGPAGRITGLDRDGAMLSAAQTMLNETEPTAPITLQQGSIQRLPFPDRVFDWAWSADCVGYAPFDAAPSIEEMIRVVRPGGALALAAWSSETLLPGYPQLEAHLKATPQGLAPFSADKQPRQHFLRSLGALKAAGLSDCKACSFCASFQAPLSAEVYKALSDLFSMRWSGVEHILDEEERQIYRSICLPGSPEFILDQPDYFAFFTYSLFQGKIA